ncbi:MAG: hypothetical protein QM651_02195 [Rhodoblastus sp.]
MSSRKAKPAPRPANDADAVNFPAVVESLKAEMAGLRHDLDDSRRLRALDKAAHARHVAALRHALNRAEADSAALTRIAGRLNDAIEKRALSDAISGAGDRVFDEAATHGA